MTLFRQRYLAESARLPEWDYASAGWYFITICTQGQGCSFGQVMDGEMRRSEIGDIVAEEWRRTELVHGDVRLDQWIFMPNHVNGIVVLGGLSIVWGRATGSSLPPIRVIPLGQGREPGHWGPWLVSSSRSA